MRPRYYSPFWLTGAVLTSPEWAARDAADDPCLEQLDTIPMGEWLRLPDVTRAAVEDAEVLDMQAWLRLTDAERGALVAGYAGRREHQVRVSHGVQKASGRC